MRLSQCLVSGVELERLLGRDRLSLDETRFLFFSDLFEGRLVYKPLGLRLFRAVSETLTRGLEEIGAEELSMPLLLGLEEMGRSRRVALGLLQNLGIEVGVGGKEFLLMPTHEEAMMLLYGEAGSSPGMRALWYQCGRKFRNEDPVSPLRLREFTMLDAYGFAESEGALREGMDLMVATLKRSLRQLGIVCYASQPFRDRLFGDESVELLARSDAGRDRARDFDEACATCSKQQGEEDPIEGGEPVLEVAHCYLLFQIYNSLLDGSHAAATAHLAGHGIGIDRVVWCILEQSWETDAFRFSTAARMADVYLRPENPRDTADAIRLEREIQAAGGAAICDDLGLSGGLSDRLAELLGVRRTVRVSARSYGRLRESVLSTVAA